MTTAYAKYRATAVAALVLIGMNVIGPLRAQTLQITLPVSGAEVHAGETLTVAVDAAADAFDQITVDIDTQKPLHQVLDHPPYQFTFQIPEDAPSGPATIRAFGLKSGSKNKNRFAATPITILLPAKATPQLKWEYFAPRYVRAHPEYLVRGCVAALVLALLCSYSRPKVRKLHHLAVVGMLGAISALPLQAYLLHHPWIDGMQWEFSGFAVAHGIWPVAVLSYIYWVRSLDKPASQRAPAGTQVPFGLIEPPGVGTRLAVFLGAVTNLLPVTAFFAFTGTWSAALCERSITPEAGNLFLVPLPFALPAAILLLRSWRAVIAAPLFVIVWLVAYFSAFFGGITFVPMLIGGAAGALGLALSCRLALARYRGPERPAVFTSENLRVAAILGGVAALPFQICLSSREMGVAAKTWEFRELSVCFSVWQALVGSYIYWVCSRYLDGARLVITESRGEE
jgi:hypothetical protein